jgi:hypothetical protein
VEGRHGLSGSKTHHSEIKVMRRTAGYSVLEHMRNKHILDKNEIQPVTEYVNIYRHNWLQHVKRMDRARIKKKKKKKKQLDDDCQVGDRYKPLGLKYWNGR